MTSEDERIRKIVDLIRELQSASYAAGAQDAIKRITSAASVMQAELVPNVSRGLPSSDDTEGNDDEVEFEQETTRRLPRGIVRQLIVRALQNAPNGLATVDIQRFALTPDEKAVNANALRTELRRGVVHGRYREEGGRWFLVSGT